MPTILTDGQALKTAHNFLIKAGIKTNGYDLSHAASIQISDGAILGKGWRIAWHRIGALDEKNDLVVLVFNYGRVVHHEMQNEKGGIMIEFDPRNNQGIKRTPFRGSW